VSDIEAQRGQLLTELRERRLWTRERLAKEAGVSPTTVGHAEQGRTLIRLDTIRKLAQALDVDPQELLHPERERALLPKADAPPSSEPTEGATGEERRAQPGQGEVMGTLFDDLRVRRQVSSGGSVIYHALCGTADEWVRQVLKPSTSRERAAEIAAAARELRGTLSALFGDEQVGSFLSAKQGWEKLPVKERDRITQVMSQLASVEGAYRFSERLAESGRLNLGNRT
jgi:transcriptional regulator with XRE-family HTH domain